MGVVSDSSVQLDEAVIARSGTALPAHYSLHYSVLQSVHFNTLKNGTSTRLL